MGSGSRAPGYGRRLPCRRCAGGRRAGLLVAVGVSKPGIVDVDDVCGTPGGTLVTCSSTRGRRNRSNSERPPYGSSAHNELQSALAGRGIAHVLDDYAKPHVQTGPLVELLSEWSLTLPHWFLYYPSRRLPSAVMRAFLDHMKNYDWQPSD